MRREAGHLDHQGGASGDDLRGDLRERTVLDTHDLQYKKNMAFSRTLVKQFFLLVIGKFEEFINFKHL